MKRIGYVQKGLKEEELATHLNALIAYGCTEVFIENAQEEELLKLTSQLEPGMEVVVYNFTSLNKRLSDLLVFINDIHKQGGILYSLADQLNSKETVNITIGELLQFAIEIDLTGLVYQKGENYQKAGQRRKELGRPKLNSEKVNEIIFYYTKKRMSYREISELTDVALGTVHKYIKEYKEGEGT